MKSFNLYKKNLFINFYYIKCTYIKEQLNYTYIFVEAKGDNLYQFHQFSDSYSLT